MDKEFWEKMWSENKIGFHEGEPNELLLAHIDRLQLAKGSRIFLPLCGKAIDIHWLLERRLHVTGIELEKSAVEQLFDELSITPEIEFCGALDRYSANNIDIYVGDIFDLSLEQLGKIDATYDRAALVALPFEARVRYARHLVDCTNRAPQLLITFNYDQSKMEGPPFSISHDELNQHYGNMYKPELLQSKLRPNLFKSDCTPHEEAWILT